MSQEKSYASIEDWMIRESGNVVFDWDNTLKLYDKSSRTLSSRVGRERLLKWKQDMNCKMFIISAIRPTKMNLETLLIELDRLKLTDVFINDDDTIQLVPGKFARKGSVIICGYDKAETFLELCQDSKDVIFFDDELVNIQNFRAIVTNSQCYLIE